MEKDTSPQGGQCPARKLVCMGGGGEVIEGLLNHK